MQSRRSSNASSSLYGSLAVICALIATGLSAAAILHGDFLYAAVGVWALTIMLAPPALIRQYDLYSPWSFVALSVVVGVTLRGFYITLKSPDFQTVNELFLLGESPSYFVWPAVTLLAGLAMLAIGYLWARPVDVHAASVSFSPNWRFYPLVFAILIVSAASTYTYIKHTGGTTSDLISAKRTVVSNVDMGVGELHQGYGLLRLLAELAIYAHLLVLADYFRAEHSRQLWKLALAGILFLAACVLPFYASSKLSIAIYLCMASAMVYYGAKRLPIGRIVAFCVIAVVMIHAMATLRRSDEGVAALLKNPLESEVVSSLTVNRNNCGLCKMAHIMDAVGRQLDYKYGQTMWVWFAAPVPRSIWPDKPMIHAGPIIGNEVYGTRVSGVPPGLIAELYWNFNLPGVFLGCLLVGWGLRWVHSRLRPVRRGNTLAAALYVAGPMYLGFRVIGESLGAGIFDALVGWTIMYVLLQLTCDRESAVAIHRHRVPASPTIARGAAA